MANIHILFFLKSFLDSPIHAFGFEFRIHEYGSQRFESHESNGKFTIHQVDGTLKNCANIFLEWSE